MRISAKPVQSVFKDLDSRAHVRLAPVVSIAHIHARRRDGSVFVWQRSVSIVKQGRTWYWYAKVGKVKNFIQLSRKRDKRFFLAGHSQEHEDSAMNRHQFLSRKQRAGLVKHAQAVQPATTEAQQRDHDSQATRAHAVDTARALRKQVKEAK